MQSEAPSVCSFVPLDWHPTSSARPGRGQEISPPENPLKSPLVWGGWSLKKQVFFLASRISSAFSNLAASAAENPRTTLDARNALQSLPVVKPWSSTGISGISHHQLIWGILRATHKLMKDLTNQSQISLVKLAALENFNYSECSYLSQVSVPILGTWHHKLHTLGHRKPLHGSAPTCFCTFCNSVSSVTAYFSHIIAGLIW